MTKGPLRYFASGHTSQGFVTLIDSSLQGMKQVYLLNGWPAIGISEFLQELGKTASQSGTEVWYLHSPFINGVLDGLVFPEPGLAVVATAGLRGHSPQAPGAENRQVDFSPLADQRKLGRLEQTIAAHRAEMNAAFERAYGKFAEALAVHDEWERIYIDNMDKAAAGRLAAETADLLLGGARREGRQGRTFLRFLGAATPEGAVDFVPELTRGLRRWLIKGRAGTGKSTLLRKVAAEAAERGFDTEVYRCGFDPDSLDMVIVRELGFAIFDSTAPHEYFPEFATDRVIDTYEACIRPGTDEAEAHRLAPVQERYRACMKEATLHLAKAKSEYAKIAQLQSGAVDYIAADLIKSDLRQELLRLVSAVHRET